MKKFLVQKRSTLFLLALLISIGANAAFITGSYVGNGASTKAITGLCFRPEVVMVVGSSSQHAWVATSTMPAGQAKDLTLADPLKTGYITSLDNGGFTVGNSSHSNTNGVTYYYTAWDDADGSISVGSFTPNSCGPDWANDTWYANAALVKYGSSNYKVIAPYGIYSNTTPNNDPTNWQNMGSCTSFDVNISTGSRPKMVWIFGEGLNWDQTSQAQYSLDGPVASSPSAFSQGGYLSTEEKIIASINSTGFSVTPVVQAGTHSGTANGVKYNYVTFNPSSTTVSGTYTGTAIDNQQINTIQGQFVIAKPQSPGAGNSWFKTCKMGTDTSYSFAGVNSVMNIKNITSSGFTVGYSGEVNGNGGSYEYFAMNGGACAISSCGPTSYYINNNSLTGDVFTTAAGVDGGSGTGTAAHPYATLNYLLQNKTVNPGDHIYIDAGSYNWTQTNFSSADQGSSTAQIIIQGAGKTLTTITNTTGGYVFNADATSYMKLQDMKLTNANSTALFLTTNSNYWTIDNCIFECTSTDAGYAALYFYNSNHETVTNSEIKATIVPLRIYNGDNNSISNSTITATTGWSSGMLRMENGSVSNTFTANKFNGGGLLGIWMESNSSGNTFVNNYFYNMTDGITMYNSDVQNTTLYYNSFAVTKNALKGYLTGAVLKNNIFQTSSTTSGDYAVNNQSNASTSDYNLYYFTSPAAAQVSGSIGSHSLSGQNPLYISTSTGNLNLLAASPAAAKGTPVSGITTDINGVSRNSSTPTIGGNELINTCTLVMSNNATTCTGANTTISVTPSGSSNYTYSWTPTTGLSNATIANPVATPTVTTTYKVTVTGDGGCYKTDSIKITISQLEWAELNGVSFSCETLTKTAADGATNGSAYSKNHLNANQDGWVEFTVNQNQYSHMGFAVRNLTKDKNDLRYGIQIANADVAPINKGYLQTSFGSIAVGDKIKIERSGNNIKYYKNGTLVLTYAAGTSAEELYIDASLYYSGHSVAVKTSFNTDFNVYAAVNDNNPGAANRDGSISLDPLNETGAVTYLWNSGATTANLTGLTSGTYTVSITDAANHSIQKTFTVLNKAVWTKLNNMSDDGTSRLTKTSASAEDGWALSKVYLPAGQDGYIDYYMTSSPNTIRFGFSMNPLVFQDGETYKDISYHIYWYGGATIVKKYGGISYSYIPEYRATSYIRIAREGNDIVFYGDGIEQYRFAGEPNQDLFLKFLQAESGDNGVFRTSFGGDVQAYYELPFDNDPSANYTGSLSVEGTSGTAPYTYSWSSGQTTQNISNLSPGDYTVTVTDAASHTFQKTLKVMNKVIWKNLNSMTQLSNGRLKKNGNDDYSNGWASSKNYLPAGENGEIRIVTSNLYNNAYVGFSAHPILFASDQTYKMVNYAVVLGSNYGFLAEGGRLVTYMNNIVGGGNEVIIRRETNSSGVTQIAYYLNGVELRRVNTYLNQDLYVLVHQAGTGVELGHVRASFGHQLQVSYEPVVDNDPLQTPSGAITVEGMGGTAPYTYSWKKGTDNTVIGTAATVNSLAPADYTVTITDANNATSQKTFTVMNKASWTKLRNVEMQASGFLKQTNLNIDGWAQSVNFIPAGEEGAFEYVTAGAGSLYLGLSQHPFVYYDESRFADITYGWFIWNYSMAIFQGYAVFYDGTVSQGANLYRIERKINTTTNNPEIIYYLNHVEVGRYVVETMDQDLYLKFSMQGSPFGQFRLSHGHQLNASALITNRNADATINGALDITAYGGTAPYTYEWQNGETSEDISGLKKGTYSVIITDANNASITKTFNIKNEINWAHTHNFSVLDGLVDEASGGSYATSKNFIEANQDGKIEFEFARTGPGYFGLSTSDNINSYSQIKYGYYQWQSYLALQHNFTYEGYVTLPSPHGSYFHNGDIVTIERVGTTLYYKIDGLLISQRTVPANERLYVAIYNPDANSRTLSVLSDFGQGPVDTATFSLQVNELVRNANCGQANGSIDLTITGGAKPYTTFWSNGSASEDLTGLASGTFVLDLIDSKGVIMQKTFEVGSSPAWESFVNANVNSTGNLTHSGGSGDAKANTVYVIPVDGGGEFSYSLTNLTTDWSLGFSDPANTGSPELQYEIKGDASSIKYYEDGDLKGMYSGNEVGRKVALKKEGLNVYFYVNDGLKETSILAQDKALELRAVIATSGASLNNISVDFCPDKVFNLTVNTTYFNSDLTMVFHNGSTNTNFNTYTLQTFAVAPGTKSITIPAHDTVPALDVLFDITTDGQIVDVRGQAMIDGVLTAFPMNEDLYDIDGLVLSIYSEPRQEEIIVRGIYVELESGMLLSPNDDDQFDEMIVRGVSATMTYQMKVLDLDDQVIFTTNNVNEHWNGKLNNTGDLVAQGVYKYELQVNEKVMVGQLLVEY